MARSPGFQIQKFQIFLKNIENICQKGVAFLIFQTLFLCISQSLKFRFCEKFDKIGQVGCAKTQQKIVQKLIHQEINFI